MVQRIYQTQQSRRMENKRPRVSELQRRRNDFTRVFNIASDLEKQNLSDLEKTKSTIVNSGQDFKQPEGEYTQEFKHVNSKQIPIQSGSGWTDYDGIAMTVNRHTQNFLDIRGRLEWCGTVIRAQEIELWRKDCVIARLEGREEPVPLPAAPHFETPARDETNPGPYVLSQLDSLEKLHKDMINRVIMVFVGWATLMAGFFLLVK